MAAEGNYIIESDIDNWPAEATEIEKQRVIDRVESLVEKLTGDYFYPKDFTIALDGNGKNRLNLGLTPSILSISSIKINGIILPSQFYAYDEHSVYRVSATTGQCKEIENITLSGTDPVLLTITSHGFITGERIRLIAVEGITPSLDGEYVVTKVDDNNLTLNGTDSSNYSGTFSSGIACFPSLAEFHYQDADDEGIFPVGTKNIEITGKYGWNSCPEEIKECCIILARYENDETLYTKYNFDSERMGDLTYDRGGEKYLTGIVEADRLLRPYIRKKIKIGVV